MSYLSPDKIFAIEAPDVIWGCHYHFGKDPLPTPKLDDLLLKCAIFDLNNKKWKQISDFICSRDEKFNNVWSMGRCICYDEYRKNILYVIGNTGDASEYNWNNDKWKYWDMERKLNLQEHCVCWMDDKNHLLFRWILVWKY